MNSSLRLKTHLMTIKRILGLFIFYIIVLIVSCIGPVLTYGFDDGILLGLFIGTVAFGMLLLIFFAEEYVNNSHD